MIYFVAEDAKGPVKIGYTAGPPERSSMERRLITLQISNWRLLRVVAMMAGELADELDLHDTLRAYHVRGEWFSRGGAVDELLRDHACRPFSVPRGGTAVKAKRSATARRLDAAMAVRFVEPAQIDWKAANDELQRGRAIVEALKLASR